MNFVEECLEKFDFTDYGFASLDHPISINYYKTWLDKNYHAGMAYMERHLEFKEEPQKLLPKAQSAIVVLHSYYPAKSESFPLKKARVSLYARQMDYHDWFLEKLNQVATQLKEYYPQEEFVAFTDSKPVLERDLANKAGLGWVGKNTCIISQKKGSLFFIGEIYTTMKLTAKLDPAADRCGTCTRCIDICPTGALVEPRVLDANKCISYLTIEAKTIPPPELRTKMEGWYFGCDLCQTVCPWNQRLYKIEMQQEIDVDTSRESLDELRDELRWILTASSGQLERAFKGTPLMRARPWAHRRNAILVAVHYQMKSLAPLIEILKENEKLFEISAWALKQLKGDF